MPFVVSGPPVLVFMSYKVFFGPDPTSLFCLISSSQHMPYAPGIPNYLQFLQILLLMYFVPSACNVFLLLFLVHLYLRFRSIVISNCFQQVQLVLSPYMLWWHCRLLVLYSLCFIVAVCLLTLFFFLIWNLTLHALEEEMATHSSVLAWRIPGRRDLVGRRLWGCTELDVTEAT